MYSSCTEKGTIDRIPEIPGLLVFMPRHVGVYIGNGKVIEARGHAYGVVETNLKDRGWKQWGKCKFIEYLESEEKKMDNEKRYNSVDEVPEWGRETISKMVNLDILQGDENGKLNISRDMLVVFVTNDRAGLYDF